MKSAKRLMVVTFILLIIVSLFFMWWMSFSSFKVSYQNIKQQYYAVVTEQVVNEIDTSVKYGKTLDSFYNIDSIFSEIHSYLSSQFKVLITNNKNEVLYTSFSKDPEQAQLFSAVSKPDVAVRLSGLGDEKYTAISENNYEIMIFPIHNNSGSQIGNFLLIYPSNIDNGEIAAQKNATLQVSLIILAVAVVILLAFFLVFQRTDKKKDTEYEETTDVTEQQSSFLHWKNSAYVKRILRVVPAVIVILSIAVQSTCMYVQYQQKYSSALEDGAKGILVYIDDTVKSLNQKGVAYNEMEGLETYLADKVKDTPILWNIQIESTLYNAGNILHRDNQLSLSLPVGSQSGNEVSIDVNISQNYLNESMRNMLLSFLVTILIVGIIVVEFIRLPDILAEKGRKKRDKSDFAGFKKLSSSLRISNFVMFLGVYASMPYSANLIRQWGYGLFGLSTDITASLPITAELLSIMLFSVLFSRIFKGRNLRLLLIISAAVMIGGNGLCVVAQSPLILILIRMLCGAGFAGIKTVINTLISYGYETSQQRGRNLSEMNAGLLGGITCGGALGAVVSESSGFSSAYIFSAAILILFAALTFLVMPWGAIYHKIQSMPTVKDEKTDISSGINIFRKGAVWRYLLLVTFPLNIGLMFIVSFIPSFIQKLGLPTLMISYSYLLNGMAGIYIGPQLSKIMTKRLGKSICISIMLIMGAVSMLLCSIAPGVAAILFSTALMGLFDGFGTPISMDYFIEIPQIQGSINGTGALAMLNVLGSATQMVSPMLYGAVMAISIGAGTSAVAILAAVYLVFAAVFALTSKSRVLRSMTE